jgi:hypothetical protein
VPVGLAELLAELELPVPRLHRVVGNYSEA